MVDSGRRATITALGHYLPEKRLTNQDFEKMMDTNDEWIVSRTGIRERRIAADDQANSDLSIEAINELLKRRGIGADELDLIVVGTVTPDMVFPSTACLIQEKIGATNAWGFDLSAACSGFLFSLSVGEQYVRSGTHSKVLVVGTDVMSSIVDYEDRATSILFGDAAGVVLLEPCDDPELGIVDTILKVDGSGSQYLKMPAGGSRMPPSPDTVEQRLHFVKQDGKTVFKYAVDGMATVARDVIERNGLTTDDIDWLVPHQANSRIIDAAGRRLGIDPEKVIVNIDRYANTTAATLPLCLYEGSDDGRIKKGDNVVLVTFGAGFTWGATLVKWSY